MYLFRTSNILDLALYILISLGWAIGGWLLSRHCFRLKASERLFGGFATGFVLFLTLSNLFAPLIPFTLAFWLASVAVLLAGLGAAWRSTLHPRIPLHDLRYWPQVVVFLVLTLFFAMLQRGVAIFDDYLHLPLVSVMATGDIPPHFYLNPSVYFAYHYGLQVFAASMVHLADFFPWSAWDLSKAVAIAFTLVLAWLWFRRLTRSTLAAALGSFVLTFGGGTRWLLLLIPSPLLSRISASVHLSNTGLETAADLITALTRPWVSEGMGPMPLPFAFHNGIFVPAMFVLGSTGALPFLTIILLLMLATGSQASKGHFSIPSIIILSLIFANLALSAEHLFAFLWLGIALAIGLYIARSRLQHRSLERGLVLQWGSVLLISALLSLIQGAFITEVARGLLARLQGVASQSSNAYGFSVRWPPALLSAHLGELSLLNPNQLLVLLAELGPALILAPIATVYAWKQLKHRNWLAAGLGAAALFSLVFPIFFQYGVDRSTTRMPATTLWLWLLLGFPAAWYVFQRARQFPRFLIALGYGVVTLGGIVILTIQMTAIPYWQLTYFVSDIDARLSQEYWDRLPKDAQVFDPIPFRAVTLFGRATRAHQSIYVPLQDWEALVAAPNPAALAQAGYSYVYLDETYWHRLSPQQQKNLQSPCVKIVNERSGAGTSRQLLDIRACKE